MINIVSSQINVWSFNGKELTSIAFYDAQILTVSMSTVKNFIVIADMYKSVQFLRWRHAGKICVRSGRCASSIRSLSG